MAKFIGLIRDEYLKEAKSLISLAEHYLDCGDLEKAEEYLAAFLAALKCARKAMR